VGSQQQEQQQQKQQPEKQQPQKQLILAQVAIRRSVGRGCLAGGGDDVPKLAIASYASSEVQPVKNCDVGSSQWNVNGSWDHVFATRLDLLHQ
jgi:hypothetical protein